MEKMKIVILFYKAVDNTIKIKLFNANYLKEKKIKFLIIYNNKLYPFQSEFVINTKKCELLKIKILVLYKIKYPSTLIRNIKPLPIDYSVVGKKYKKKKNNYYEYLKCSIYSFSIITYNYFAKERTVNIFGETFVKNNKSKCAIIYQGQILPLTSKLNINIIHLSDHNSFTIILIEFESIDDKSYMFHNCYFLIGFSLPNYKYKKFDSKKEEDEILLDSKNSELLDNFYQSSGMLSFKNLKTVSESSSDKISLFEGYSKLTFSVDLSRWNTCNCTNLSKMFYNCDFLS